MLMDNTLSRDTGTLTLLSVEKSKKQKQNSSLNCGDVEKPAVPEGKKVGHTKTS